MTTADCVSKAVEVRKKYNPENLSPFPYDNILKDNQELKIFFGDVDADSISGATSYTSDNGGFYLIVINQNKPFTRQHFTLAHELGHYFLHKEILKTEEILVTEDKTIDGAGMLFRIDDAQYDKIETEANNFAAELIMPRELVVDAWGKLKDIQECAKIFKVSASAMSIRLEKLKLLAS